MTIDDAKFAYLRAEGYTGSLDDMYKKYLEVLTGLTGAIPDLEKAFFSGFGYTGSVQDGWKAFLDAYGYTGALPEKQKEFWSTGFVQTLIGSNAGYVFDNTRMDTMFSDRAGTTAAVLEGPVGLQLGLDKNLALGASLVSTGAVALVGSATAATYNTTTGVGTATRIDLSNQSSVGFATTSTLLYKITVTCTSGTGLWVRLNSAGGTQLLAVTTGNTGICHVTAGTSFHVASQTGTAGFTVSVFQQVLGTHRIAPSDGARRTLSRRYNLLTYTKSLANAAWTNISLTCTKTDNAATAPDGTLTASEYSETSTANAQRGVINTFTTVSGTSYRMSMQVNGNTLGFVQVLGGSGGFGTTAFSNFTLSGAGSVGTAGAGALNPYIIALSRAGWYEIGFDAVATASSASAGLAFALIPDAAAARLPTYTPSSVRSIYIAQPETTLTIHATLPHQWVTDGTATGYDTSNVFPLYLRDNGVGTTMQTVAAVDFSGSDKATVFAGLTKLSDATYGVAIELGSNVGAISGTFLLALGRMSGAAGAYYTTGSRGTAAINANQFVETAGIFASPHSDIITMQEDISGDSSILRINGSAVGTATGDKGAGNWSSRVVNFGARNAVSAWIIANTYLDIAVAKTLTAAEISSIERYIASKMGGLVTLA